MNFRHMDKRLNLCELSLEVFVAVIMIQNISKQLLVKKSLTQIFSC